MLNLKDGMQDSFKIDGGMRDEKQKITRLRTIRGELQVYPGSIMKILSRVGQDDGMKTRRGMRDSKCFC